MPKSTLLYDPASGWQYGFPKPYEPKEGESLKATLIRDGYPADMAQQVQDNKLWCRFIGSHEDLMKLREKEKEEDDNGTAPL